MSTGNNRGVTLLIAIVVALLVLSVGLSLTVLSVKEFNIAGTVRDSLMALYAAESGAECSTYWMLQLDDYFDESVNSRVYCNGQPSVVGGSTISNIVFNQEGKYFSKVTLERTDPTEKEFDIDVSGYSSDPDIADPSPRLLQQSLGLGVEEKCTFDPSNADAFGDDAPPVVDFTEHGNPGDLLQNTLDYFYPPAGTIDAEADQKKYQGWKLNTKGTVYIEVQPYKGYASYSNVFGYYINDPDNPQSDPAYIEQNLFVPIYKNHTLANFYLDPNIPEIGDNSSSGIIIPPTPQPIKFKIDAEANDVIAFAVSSYGSGYPTFKSTELVVNDVLVSGNPVPTDSPLRDFALAYDVPSIYAPNPVQPEYILGFEDRGERVGLSDSDFEDVVAQIKILSCVVTVNRF